MTRKLLFGVALLALASCVKEEVKPVDFICQVNGREWQMNNPGIVLFKSDYKIVAFRDLNDSGTITIRAIADEGKEVILSSFDIRIRNFKGAGTYTADISDVSAMAVTSKQGNMVSYSTYVLDKAKPYKVVIQEYTLNNRVKGIFSIPLIIEFGSNGVNPDHIILSGGRFDCPDRLWN